MVDLRMERVKKLTVDAKGRSYRTDDDSGVPYAVMARASGDSHAFAYVERDWPAERLDAYRSARRQGVRGFALWADQHRTRRLGTVRTEPGSTRARATYLVYGAAGEQIGTVTVEKASAFPPRRTRWTVRQPGHPPAVASKGKVVWWWVWLLLLPVMVATVVLSFFSSSGDGIGAASPKRTIWRADGRTVLDYRRTGTYHDPASWLDPTLVAALVALHGSHQDGVPGGGTGPWDVRS